VTRIRSPLVRWAAFSLVGYCLAAWWFPLRPEHHRAPLPDIYSFTPSLGGALAYAAWLSLLFGLYWLAYRYVRSSNEFRASTLGLLTGTLLFALPLIWAFPINAIDIYQYYLHGRTTAVFRQSPFTVAPLAASGASWAALAGEWADHTSPYGPLWEWVSAGVAAVSPYDIQTALVLFKVFNLMCLVAVGGLIGLMSPAATPTSRAARVLLWSWNPAVLLIYVMDGHNDILMLFWWLLGAWLLQRRRWWGLVVLVLAPLTKPIGLLPLPFFYLTALRNLPDWRTRVRWLVRAGLVSLLVALAAWAPFLALDQTPGASVVGAARRLQFEAGGGGGFSPKALMVLLEAWLGTSGLASSVMLVVSAALVLWVLWLLVRTTRGASPGLGAAGALVAYLLQAFKFRIWYAAWPFPWLVLDRSASGGRVTAGVWFLFATQLSPLIYGHLRRLVLQGDLLIAHAIGVPLTFVVPVVAAWLAGLGRKRRQA